ncbi:MAG TPA: N-acetylmuramic acid 6-phosphate etherase [Geminicoccaceae bacterium]|jgi:N-acetylmuramic acid 6-phosphate etherase|nr:N-acetylmuramic acid 6-phosphate etherase [Geminicoccaceae bacterium]
MDTEDRLERYRDADTWPIKESLAAMLDSQMAAFVAVRNALPALARAAEAAAARLERGGRLVYAGAGASGRLAVQDGVELHPTFGWPRERLCYLIAGGDPALVRSIEGAEDDAAAAAAAAEGLALGEADVVVAVAASGRTTFTCAVQRRARGTGALTIGLANNPGTPLLGEAEIPVLLETGPEFLAGSTRMAAGTAQKIALNLLSTQTMIALGRVYQGFMVDVVPTNAKLVARAKGIVRALTGCTPDQAEALWARAGGDLKLAVLLGDGIEPEQARRRLEAAGGNLRRARDSSRL